MPSFNKTMELLYGNNRTLWFVAALNVWAYHQLWYALGKLRAEKAAWRIAEEQGLRLTTICSALITGPQFCGRNPTPTIAYLKGITIWRNAEHSFLVKLLCYATCFCVSPWVQTLQEHPKCTWMGYWQLLTSWGWQKHMSACTRLWTRQHLGGTSALIMWSMDRIRLRDLPGRWGSLWTGSVAAARPEKILFVRSSSCPTGSSRASCQRPFGAVSRRAMRLQVLVDSAGRRKAWLRNSQCSMIERLSRITPTAERRVIMCQSIKSAGSISYHLQAIFLLSMLDRYNHPAFRGSATVSDCSSRCHPTSYNISGHKTSPAKQPKLCKVTYIHVTPSSCQITRKQDLFSDSMFPKSRKPIKLTFFPLHYSSGGRRATLATGTKHSSSSRDNETGFAWMKGKTDCEVDFHHPPTLDY